MWTANGCRRVTGVKRHGEMSGPLPGKEDPRNALLLGDALCETKKKKKRERGGLCKEWLQSLNLIVHPGAKLVLEG